MDLITVSCLHYVHRIPPLVRVGDNEYESEVFEKTPEAGTSATATGPALTLKEELEKQLKQEKETFKKKPDNKQRTTPDACL
ncbi:hypothetical protein ILUMI_06626 [Ignelater luminosus]|uniref:Uncharacterized protein n=1 Tax=Ignelater luminosus TaxID=2038154 RepID=A0A8K0D9K7_IGNLU|nr:hypothetical protein ILUMI_06626 [Ignelater luminosus]